MRATLGINLDEDDNVDDDLDSDGTSEYDSLFLVRGSDGIEQEHGKSKSPKTTCQYRRCFEDHDVFYRLACLICGE